MLWQPHCLSQQANDALFDMLTLHASPSTMHFHYPTKYMICNVMTVMLVILFAVQIMTSSPWSSPPRQQHTTTPAPTPTDQDHTAQEHLLCNANPTAGRPYASRGVSPPAGIRPELAAVAALAQPAVCTKSAVQRTYEKLKYAAQPRQSNKQHKYRRVFPQTGKRQ
ncbi:TPA: hypothetical protein ACH3X3_002887 [Trebouxia sp. C0006]